MRALAYHDPLTGLSNRRQALDELNMLAGNDSEAGIVLLDLDEFNVLIGPWSGGLRCAATGRRPAVPGRERRRNLVREQLAQQ